MTLRTGSMFATYEILAPLGAGGMGEVYRARDTRLGREVAIKVLPVTETEDPIANARLVREAQTASHLNHPHICTIHDSNIADGRVYVAMELVEGTPLSEILTTGPLSSDRVIRYGTQVADALAHAHQRGIVHRDLKSANIMITPDGRAKVLDFGLARRIDNVHDAQTAAALTEAGAIVGTFAYMAPEVLRGGAADTRSDIWSLGVVLFEMAAGRRPFDGASVFEQTSAIMTAAMPPLPAAVPQGLASIVHAALAKAPGERYQQAAELRAALEAVRQSNAPPPPDVAVRWRRGGMTAAALAIVAAAAALGWGSWRMADAGRTAPAIHAIAVLPFANLSGEPSQDLFVDGITDALITNLARVRGLDVISRTSVMQYRNASKRLPDIARELTVDAVVQGSVVRAGGRVRVSAQLIDAVNDRHLWADEYERDVSDVLVLQRDIARAIAQEVKVTLSPQEAASLSGGRRVAPDAHDMYLRARVLILRFNEESIAEAIRLLEAALQIEPEFADAWAMLASAHAERGIWGNPPSSRETGARARAAVTRALALDATSSEALSILGNISLVYDWDWAGAERALDRGVEVAAGGAQPRNLRASLYQALRRFPEAVAEAERYRRLDPASVNGLSLLGRARYRARQFDEAIAAFNDSIALDPGYGPNYARLADVYLALGRPLDAIRVLEQGQRVLGQTRRQVDGFALAYAQAGRRREAEAMRDELIARSTAQDQSYYSLAMVEVALGHRDAAFEWLERAYQARSANLFLVDSEIKFDPIRDDPRFTDLLRSMGFPRVSRK